MWFLLFCLFCFVCVWIEGGMDSSVVYVGIFFFWFIFFLSNVVRFVVGVVYGFVYW